MTRLLATLALLVAAGAIAADDPKDDPKSNNAKVILGRWKVVEPPEKLKKDFRQLSKFGIHLYVEFRLDNVLAVGAGAEEKEAIDLLEKTGGAKKVSTAKYRLAAGDRVEVSGVKDEEPRVIFQGETARPDIVVKKDEMTLTHPDGTAFKLTRISNVKDEKKPEK
jgi:hypothetical protein